MLGDLLQKVFGGPLEGLPMLEAEIEKRINQTQLRLSRAPLQEPLLEQ